MGAIGQGEYRSKLAYADLSDYQYRFVVLRTDDTVELADSTSDFVYGILQNTPEAGEAASVKVSGESLLDATSTSGLAVNTVLASNNSGQGQAAVSGQYARAVVTKANSSASSLVTAQLIDSGSTIA